MPAAGATTSAGSAPMAAALPASTPDRAGCWLSVSRCAATERVEKTRPHDASGGPRYTIETGLPAGPPAMVVGHSTDVPFSNDTIARRVKMGAPV